MQSSTKPFCCLKKLNRRLTLSFWNEFAHSFSLCIREPPSYVYSCYAGTNDGKIDFLVGAHFRTLSEGVPSIVEG